MTRPSGSSEAKMCSKPSSLGNRSRTEMLVVLYANGAPEEIRTPDPQIRGLGEHFRIARGTGSDHDFLRSATAQQNHGPVPGLPVPRIGRVLLWPVARIRMRGRTCRHRVGSLKPGFKDSADTEACQETGLSSKDSNFRHRPNDGNLSQPRVSVRIRQLEKCPDLLGFSHVAITWRRGRPPDH
jgi:hypothetical protein